MSFWEDLKSVPVLGTLAGIAEGVGQGLGLVDNPEQGNVDQAFQQSAQAYQQYRPQMIQARIQALNQALGVLQGPNNLLERMYGPGVAPQIPLAGNPFNPRLGEKRAELVRTNEKTNPGPFSFLTKPAPLDRDTRGRSRVSAPDAVGGTNPFA